MTQHPPHTPPPTAKPLAVELRQILAELGDNPEWMTRREGIARERLLRLIEHVERVGAEPAEHELEAIHTGLDLEQEIRARALAAAAHLLAPTLGGMTLTGVHANLLGGIIPAWLDAAERGAGLIRDGSRP